MNDLQKSTTTNELALPDEMLSGPTGYETLDSECISLPFLKIAQPTSEECKRGGAKYIPGLEGGFFFIPSMRKVIGEKVRLVILKFYRAYSVFDGEGTTSKFKGVMSVEDFARTGAARKEGKSYSVDSRGFRYVDTRNFVVLNYDCPEDGPLVFTLASTGIAPSKRWLTMAQTVKVPGKGVKAPMWVTVWELGTALQSNDLGSYYQINTIDKAGFVANSMVAPIKQAFDDAQSIVATEIRTEEHEVAAEDPRPVSDGESVVRGVFGPKGAVERPARPADDEIF